MMPINMGLVGRRCLLWPRKATQMFKSPRGLMVLTLTLLVCMD
jgi:hypothetical protein